MTDAIRLPGTRPKGDRIAPLQGVLVAESDREISVRVAEGTWTFCRSDVLRVVDSAVPQADQDGRPVLVDIRAGATADFTRRLRIDLVDRPMTIPESPSAALGDEQLRQLTETWADRLQLVDCPGAGGATYTYCQTKSINGSDDGINCDSLD
ncbi:hypothetical protein IU427_00720 [Nocardia beijingensis]|uniref:hypothetical protein n=1 Tax=Nocardia beijingensis TaxID=95162 RepID=UPI0018951FC8|nr:hypothetical protein [Nocardia beijingensis]MBF6463700.1 hypothetical protein [Nocardia beijingensis]